MVCIGGVTVEQNHFSDGTLFLKTGKALEDDIVHIQWFYENDAELFTVVCLAKKCGNKKKTLYMPYIPHARQDRVKTEEDTFTLKYFSEVINSLKFEKVYVLDPHSSISEALIDNICVMSPGGYIYKTCGFLNADKRDDFLLFYPDEGSMKRYSSQSSYPYAYGLKKRDWKSGEILGLDVVDNGFEIAGKTVLIVDDICSKGGTFYHSAKKLKELGAKEVHLYVTHCENTILEGELLTGNLVETVFTTDSICTVNHDKIKFVKQWRK